MDIGTGAARRRTAAAALVAGPAAVGLGLLAHLAAGGAAPPAPVVAALTALTGLAASAAARHPLPAWALGVGAGVLQQALHLAFAALAGPNAPLVPAAGHAHHHAAAALPAGASAAAAPEDLHLMVVAHVAAALATALLMAWALRAAERQQSGAAPAPETLPTVGQRPLPAPTPRRAPELHIRMTRTRGVPHA